VAAKVISITKRIGHCCDYDGISMSRVDLANDEVAYDNLISEMLSPRIVAGTLLIDLK
jgi:hypothetical protein